jgi:hypothetical protein
MYIHHLSIYVYNNASSAEPGGLLKLKRFVLLRSGNCIEVKSDMTNTPECRQAGVAGWDSRMGFNFMPEARPYPRHP